MVDVTGAESATDPALGSKGVGEIGPVGIASAVANGVHHAMGEHVRSLPRTLDVLV